MSLSPSLSPHGPARPLTLWHLLGLRQTEGPHGSPTGRKSDARNQGTDGFAALTPGEWPPSKGWVSPGRGTDGRGVGPYPQLALVCHGHQVRVGSRCAVIPADHPPAKGRWQQQRELDGAAAKGCVVPGGCSGVGSQRGTGTGRTRVGPASLRASSSPGAICSAAAVSDSRRVRQRECRGDTRHRRSPSVTCQPRHLHQGNGYRRRPWHSPGARARPALCLRVGTAAATTVTVSTPWPCHPRLPCVASVWHPTAAHTPQARQVLTPRVCGDRGDPRHGIDLNGCSQERDTR